MALYYTEDEAASLTGVDAQELAVFRRQGALSSTHQGGQVLYAQEDIDALVEDLANPARLRQDLCRLLRRVEILEHEAALRSRYATHPPRAVPTAQARAARRAEREEDVPPWSVEQVLAAVSEAMRTSVDETVLDLEQHGDDALGDLDRRLQRMRRHLEDERRLDMPDVYALIEDAQVRIEALRTHARRRISAGS